MIEDLKRETNYLKSQIAHSQDDVEEKDIRINQIISANKELYRQMMEVKVKVKTISSLSSASPVPSDVKSSQTD